MTAGEQTRREATTPAGEAGFTLIETAVAMIILLVGCLAAVSLFTFATRYNTAAYDRTLAQAFAQKVMEETRSTSFSSLVSSPRAATYSGEGRQFNSTTSVCTDPACGGSASIKRVTVSVAPANAAASWAATPLSVVTLRSLNTTGPYYGR
ncbi:MAG TPA: prepilin-type N-terminal cleavage/methylation domain-containing protein [Pyrinomonadaceae bacterium]|nr:prepilin-type N-terminal cleavage/methylation domain-containing protein [Pyrinomonadaceae bacterium]